MSTTWGDQAVINRLLAANQRQLAEMLRLIDRHPMAHYDRYEAMLARAAQVDDLLSWERGTAATGDDPHAEARWETEGGAPEATIPDPSRGREQGVKA